MMLLIWFVTGLFDVRLRVEEENVDDSVGIGRMALTCSIKVSFKS